jgi:Importin beta binding domain
VAVEYSDPLKKREEFAISLRKRKKEEILKKKRSKFFTVNGASNNSSAIYNVCPLFCYAGLIPGREVNSDLLSLREVLISMAPFLAENFAEGDDLQIVSNQ